MKKNRDIFIQTELIGNSNGNKFNDLTEYSNLADQEKSIKAIKIWSGDVIDGIEFIYNDGKSYKKGESPFFHGGMYGQEKTFAIRKGDTIRKITGIYDLYPESLDQEQQNKILIRKIRFETHGGDVSPMYGNEFGKQLTPSAKDFLIDVGDENMVCSVFGTSLKKNMELHGYINSIGFVFTKMYKRYDLMGVESDYMFDDLVNYKGLKAANKTLRGIRVWCGDVIDCVEAVYGEEKGYEKGKSPFFHGGKKGDNYSYFQIDENDALKKVTCIYGSYPGTNDSPELYILIKIKFETYNGKQSEMYGHFEKHKTIKEQKEFVIEAEDGKAICTLYGYTRNGENMRLYNFIRALGFYAKQK